MPAVCLQHADNSRQVVGVCVDGNLHFYVLGCLTVCALSVSVGSTSTSGNKNMLSTIIYLWAALTVGLVLWLQAPRGAWRWNDLLAMSLCWPVGPVIYCLVKRN